MTTILLGGSASPIGWSVQYVDAPYEQVLPGLLTWRRGLGQELQVSATRPFPDVLDAFVPFEAPWSRELVMPCGLWTAYLNNSVNGGDPSASIRVIANQLGVRWVGAMSTLRHGPGHQATMLQVEDYAAGGPRTSSRSMGAFAEDGRWSWEEYGTPLPFEDLERYRARLKRDRLDRPALLTYLAALGVPADDDAAYGPGVVVQQIKRLPRERLPRTVTLAEARAELAEDTRAPGRRRRTS